MYPSGSWRGFWQQEFFGRQEMEQFELHFLEGRIRGQGTDIVGPFLFRGEYDDQGNVTLIKQYVGKHTVVYRGQPDGEGSILGTWAIGADWSGPFLMQPVRPRLPSDAPIRDLSR